jgi:chorismate dehydratase
MWTARAGADLGGLDIALSESRDAGLAHLQHIAQQEGPPLGLTAEACYRYLHDNLHFTLGEEEQRGLELYYQHAAALGMAPEGLEMPFRVYA